MDRVIGNLRINNYDEQNERVETLESKETSIRFFGVSGDWKLVFLCSNEGYYVKVFRVEDCSFVWDCVRSSLPFWSQAEILHVSASKSFLALISNNLTIHVFDLDKKEYLAPLKDYSSKIKLKGGPIIPKLSFSSTSEGSKLTLVTSQKELIHFDLSKLKSVPLVEPLDL